MSLRSLLAPSVLLALLACGPSDPEVASTPETPPGLVVENPTGPRPFHHDMGVLELGQVGHHVFEVRNRASVPATITRVQSDCGCTVPRLLVRLPKGGVREGSLHGDGPVIVVPPDAVLEVAVQLDTEAAQSRNAHRLYRVTALTDLPQSAYLQFELTAFVDAPLQI
ncbi:MAG: DUF1573 domain-containing protein, partial [Chloroflexi bacterium]|nr:DUF1573 domain-containing protein [Chloroflexota bacterium]